VLKRMRLRLKLLKVGSCFFKSLGAQLFQGSDGHVEMGFRTLVELLCIIFNR
jgi:hypothetical protein